MTSHKIITADSENMPFIEDESVNLIVTSPPYPMIAMWDELFIQKDADIKADLERGDGMNAFAKMHICLSRVWRECDRVLSDGGFICINIGDAVRSFNGSFGMYSNHARIIDFFEKLGYTVLPDIHWRKPVNSPNKFMGSGMFPAGAYVTYEHEYILIFRKGGKRQFNDGGKEKRRRSAYFWEERNVWFSDLWEINGAMQEMKRAGQRSRNASYPLEIPYRLVNMYSIEGDTVLDPFCGLGTTNIACMASNRNSIGVELSAEIAETALIRMNESEDIIKQINKDRLSRHNSFIHSLPEDKLQRCYKNIPHQVPVKTKQEIYIRLPIINKVTATQNIVYCE